MNIEDLMKPMKVVYSIKGGDPLNRYLAESKIMTIYNKTAHAMNSKYTEEYNREWDLKHPDVDNVWGNEEYESGYAELYKRVSVGISKTFGKLLFGKHVYLDSEDIMECCLINPEKGEITIKAEIK